MSASDEIPDSLIRAFNLELLRFHRRSVVVPDGSRLDVSAFRILWILDKLGASTMGELRDELRLEQSTVSRQVAATIKNQLVERIPGTPSTRPLLRPTRRGEIDLAHDLEVRAAVYRLALTQLGPERVAALVASLQSFSDTFDPVETRSKDTPAQ